MLSEFQDMTMMNNVGCQATTNKRDVGTQTDPEPVFHPKVMVPTKYMNKNELWALEQRKRKRTSQ